MDENFLTVVDESGNEILCEILFTFDSEDYNKSYVFYVPVGSQDDDEEVEVQCSSYIPQEDGSIGNLSEIEDDEEWDMVEEVFDTYMSNMEEDDDYDDDFEYDEDDDECCCDHDHECCCEDDDDDEECCHHHHHDR